MKWPWRRKDAAEERAFRGAEHLVPWPAAGGQTVTVSRAEGVATAMVCIQLIAETCASLPLKVYRRREDGGREEATDHPLSRVLRRPNDTQTAFEWREMMVAAMLTHGNAFSRVVLNSRGGVAELVPYVPEDVSPVRLVNGRVAYDVSTRTGRERLLAEEMLHLKWRTRDGVRGLSPIALARETFGTALAEQEFQGAVWRNGARPSAVLEHPHKLGPVATQSLSDSFAAKFSGSGVAGRVVVLEEGMSLKPWSLTAKDAEFIAARKLTAEDICRIFNVPPPVAHILDNATYSNISEQMKAFVRLTVRPWLKRIEDAMNARLLSETARRTHFVEHSVEGLLRADTKDRFEAYRIAREWGWLSPNDIRRLENLSPIANGDTYTSPLNMAPLGHGGAPNGE